MNSKANLNCVEKIALRSLNPRATVLERGRLRRIRDGFFVALFSFLTFGSWGVAFADSGSDSTQKSESKFNFDSGRECVWETEVGDGFRKHATEAGILGGYSLGLRAFGSSERHNLVLGSVHIGTMLTGLVATNHFWRGNFEILGELFGGEQVHPRNAYLVGALPMLRYNFATGTPIVPFLEGGAGASLTDIRHPDLSTDFEFNLQGGLGVHWFFKRNMAASLEGRLLHLSNAGIDHPNNGVNTVLIQAGLNWFF